MTDYYAQMKRWEEKQRFRKGVAVLVFAVLVAAAVWLAGKGFGVI